MIDVPLNDRLDAEALLTALDTTGARDADAVRFVCADKLFADTSALATLAAWGAAHHARGGVITVDGADNTVAYLSRMNVLDALGLERRERGDRRVGSGRLIEVTPLLAADGRFTDAVCDLVLHHFDDPSAFVPALEWAVNEVVDNVHNHASSASPGFACAQYYPRRHRIEIAVVDCGRGLRDTLSEGHDVPDDETAIRLALARGVTRSLTAGMGNGLAGTHAIVSANGGSLTLWTGTRRYRLHRDGEQPFHVIPAWQGTGIRLSLDTRRPVDLEDTFIEGTGWSYVDSLASRMEEQGLKVAAACSFFGARPPATRLRRKVLAVLEAMEDGVPLVLDFEGVERPSSSFVDELLGRLADELGVEVFRERIIIRNASEETAKRANVVITQRVGRPD